MRRREKAVELEPNLSRTQTVLGFAQLTGVKTDEARGAFEKAIALDQADPLPRLGLGLAKIRDGDLEEGGRELEIAASLDPSNAIVRSYLGKAYYEEKRGRARRARVRRREAARPERPDAVVLRRDREADDEPSGRSAARAWRQAIELNDNRAVYRSQLLLDADLAARSASLGRIYSDLGFQSWRSSKAGSRSTPTRRNFSAHRFLADSYAALPRHEIARVSELLQSQLLQPIT